MKLVSFSENPQGTLYLAICIAFQVLACFAIVLRFWSRAIQKITPQVSDWAIIAALILSIANLGVLGASVRIGLGLHIGELQLRDPELVVTFFKLQTTISAIWTFNLFFVKVSILDTYIKIFRVPLFIKICYAYLVVQVLWLIGAFLNIILLCRPLAYLWDKTIPGGVCADLEASYFSAHIIILVLDFGLAVLPIPVLWKLRMSTRKKIGVSLMFSIGLVIGSFDLMRIAWRDKVTSPDVTYDYALMFCFTLLEPQLGIVLASIPIMQPVLRKWTNSGPLARFRTIFAGSRGTTVGKKSTHLKTFGSGNNRTKGHSKLQFSDTDSVRPLGGEGSIEGADGSGTPNLKSDHAYDDHHRMGSGTIKVTQTWDVHR